ncbi:MAG: hypothetical protein AB198_01910 [Parcubacteria bacterium C7867-003]|nr:MAG: hypothetical protein AB198_01910 [Parcubacteria bacterium C7867-003]
MKKNVVQDVIPGKKSIRNVKLQSSRSIEREEKTNLYTAKKEPAPVMEEDFSRPVAIKQAPMRIEPITPSGGSSFGGTPLDTKPSVSSSYKYEYNEPKKTGKKWLYFSVGLLVLAIAFGVSAMFKSANIKISPKKEAREISETFVAKKDAVTGLAFQTVTVSKDVEKTVKGTGEEKVEKKSQGRIVIYNNYNNQPQKLVATTRFQTPEGLIFRLVSPVTVPGRTVSGSTTVPGSVEVLVEADKPGVSYNIGLKDFTIPGFKGDPKYTTVYARSKTEMTGGFSGMQKIVSKEVLAQAETEMKAELESMLIKDIEAQIPANFISYKEGLSYTLDPITQVPNTGKEDVVLRKRGKTSAVIFDRGALTKIILGKLMPEVESETVKITNLADLGFKIDNVNTDLDKQVSFTLSGNANFVWVFDQNKLENDLLGLNKKSAKSVIANYPGISEAWIETKPFWNQNIPKDLNKVTIINTAE